MGLSRSHLSAVVIFILVSPVVAQHAVYMPAAAEAVSVKLILAFHSDLAFFHLFLSFFSLPISVSCAV